MLSAMTLTQRPYTDHEFDMRIKLLMSALPPAEIALILAAAIELFPLLKSMLATESVHKDEIEHFSLKKIWKGVREAVGSVAQTGLLQAVPVVGPALQVGTTMIGEVPGPGAASSSGSTQMPAASEVRTPSGTSQQVLEARRAYLAVARASGPVAAMMMIEDDFPEIFSLLLMFAKYSKGVTREQVIRAQQLRGRDVEYDTTCMPCNTRLGDFAGKLPVGQFFVSPTINASVARGLGGGVYGEVNLSRMPFKLKISDGSSPARARIALAHELAHVANKLYKLGLSHTQVHEVGLFYATEGLPMYTRFVEHIGDV